MRVKASCVSILAFVALFKGAVAVAEDDEVKYGADISFPMQHTMVSTNYPWLPHNVDPSLSVPADYKDMAIQPLGNKQQQYEEYIQGCMDHYGAKRGKMCLSNEDQRLAMSLRQPKGMYNYTKLGYTKIRAPDEVMKLLKEYWDANKDSQKEEKWPTGNTYVNHWNAKSHLVSVEDTTLKGGGYVLKQHIWNAARDTISEWTGQQLAECSLYGIRVYHEGAVLAPHVDRLPLVSSAIINVDQDVDEPWPLEVIGHDGIAVNVTMEPGDLVLYESHSIIHGRPFPLKGRFMANVFVHFEPIGDVGEEIVIDSDLPKYVIPGSEEEKNWRRTHPNGYNVMASNTVTTGSTDIHGAAMQNDPERLKRLLKKQADQVNKRDANGWMPLHEAVRAGHLDIVKTLLDNGAALNARTKGKGSGAAGGTPLWWALKYHPENHEIVVLLKSKDAKNFGPGDDKEL